MKQKQPKFSGILVVAVLMVLVLFIVSLSPLLAASGSKDTTYSEIYYYFENQQVTSFRLDLGTGSLELWLKEGKAALPESNAAASLPTGGLLTGVMNLAYRRPKGRCCRCWLTAVRCCGCGAAALPRDVPPMSTPTRY